MELHRTFLGEDLVRIAEMVHTAATRAWMVGLPSRAADQVLGELAAWAAELGEPPVLPGELVLVDPAAQRIEDLRARL